MSDAVTLASSIFRDPRPAQERLVATVRDLTRARRDQLLLESAWTGLSSGLLLSCIWVLLVRIVPLPFNPWIGVACLVMAATMAAALVAWRRRPDELQVAILADLELDLQQKLSTAWELRASGTDEALIERLAEQAVKSVNIPRRCAYLFPRRANLWGRLTPAAAILLVLAGIVDVRRESIPAPPAPLDPLLAGEGERLREYGREMETRARRQGLMRSVAESQSLQRLGSRMAGSGLARQEALARLRELGMSLDTQRRQALSAGTQVSDFPDSQKATDGIFSTRDAALGELLQELLEGDFDPVQLGRLSEQAMMLSGAGVRPQDLRTALERLAEGEPAELREILERLSRVEPASREARELESAGEQVRLTRENLGDSERERETQVARIARAGIADGDPGRSVMGPGQKRFPGDEDARAAVYVTTRRSGRPTQPTETLGADSRSSSADPDVLIKPESRLGEGAAYSTRGRVLPRVGGIALENVELDARFAAQVEEVLSKEEIPLHERELVRRYFLSLSQGVTGESSRREGGTP